jgi:hypothetical protein
VTSPLADHDHPDATDVPADTAGTPTARDAGPVDDTDAQAAADGLAVPERVAEHYADQLERSAHQQGEGAV